MSNKSDHTTVSKYPAADKDTAATTMSALALTDDVKRLEYLPEEGIIRVIHYVSGEGPSEDDMSWDAALRSVETMEEYISPGAEAFQVVFDMMHLVAHYKCEPTKWVVGTDGRELIDQWLELKDRGMPAGNHVLMGIPLIELKSLPQESLILCGSKYSGARPEEITFAVKTAVEIRSSHEHGNLEDSEASYRRRNGSAEHGTAAGSVEASTSELRIPRWNFID